MIKLLVLRCEDIHVTKDFYESILGVKFQGEVHGSGAFHYAHEKDGFVLELYPKIKHNGDTERDDTRLGFLVDSVHESIATLDPVVLQKCEIRNNVIYTILVDPDGRKVEITDAAHSLSPSKVLSADETSAIRDPNFIPMTIDEFENKYGQVIHKFHNSDNSYNRSYEYDKKELYNMYMILENEHFFQRRLEYWGLGRIE